MEAFQQHQKQWFLNRVGEMVVKQFTIQTPIKVRESHHNSMTLMICNRGHAEALYLYHRDNRINFIEQKN